MNATKILLIGLLFLCSGNAFAQSVKKDPAAVIELGAAASASLKGAGWSFGPDFAVEVTHYERAPIGVGFDRSHQRLQEGAPS